MITEDPTKRPTEQPIQPPITAPGDQDTLGVVAAGIALPAPHSAFSEITDVTGGHGTADDLPDPA